VSLVTLRYTNYVTLGDAVSLHRHLIITSQIYQITSADPPALSNLVSEVTRLDSVNG